MRKSVDHFSVLLSENVLEDVCKRRVDGDPIIEFFSTRNSQLVSVLNFGPLVAAISVRCLWKFASFPVKVAELMS